LSTGVDLCIADFLVAAANVPTTGRIPLLLFQHNVEHMIWKRLSDVERVLWRRALLEVEWKKMRRYEARACEEADLTLAVSDADRELLETCAPPATIRTIPTGVDIEYFHPAGCEETPASLVFTGAMDWYPNEDAMLHFIEAILPAIRRSIPEVSLSVVGRNPSERLRSVAARAGVHVTGTVEDVRPHVARAAVCIVPLRVGGGSRLKIFEALAMGKAVVSTTIGAEGLPVVPGQHLLLAGDAENFAQTVTSLLRDPERRQHLACAGRRLVEERYSWARVTDAFETHCEHCLGRR
jgi:glycosyltransferase involved in cell wall biosynthesis